MTKPTNPESELELEAPNEAAPQGRPAAPAAAREELDPLALDIDAAFDALQMDDGFAGQLPASETAQTLMSPGRPLSTRPLAGADDWGFISLEPEAAPAPAPLPPPRPPPLAAPRAAIEQVDGDALELTEIEAVDAAYAAEHDEPAVMDLEADDLVSDSLLPPQAGPAADPSVISPSVLPAEFATDAPPPLPGPEGSAEVVEFDLGAPSEAPLVASIVEPPPAPPDAIEADVISSEALPSESAAPVARSEEPSAVEAVAPAPPTQGAAEAVPVIDLSADDDDPVPVELRPSVAPAGFEAPPRVEAVGGEPAQATAPKGEPATVAAAEVEIAEFEPVFGDGDDEMELVIDAGEEEVDIAAPAPRSPDRGALLAATVTSRRREVDGLDRLYLSDARAEARARAELLLEECEGRDGTEAAEWLALAAETLDGLGERARGRQVAERARALGGAAPSVVRVLMRMALADGDRALARALCEESLDAGVTDDEATQLRLLAAELGAAERGVDGAAHWDVLAEQGSVLGAVAGLFASAARRDNAAMGAALERWASSAQGGLGATINVARARIVEAEQTDEALLAIREAVRRDATDASAWMAMARIALAKVQPSVLHEALAGLAQAGEGGALGTAAWALRRVLGALLGDAVEPGSVDDAGVTGWLNAHALRESGADPGPQVERAVERSEGAERGHWVAWSNEPRGGGAGGLFAALRGALSRGAGAAAVAGEFLAGDDAASAVAGLAAREGRVEAEEVELIAATGSRVLRGGLAAQRGADAAEAAYDVPSAVGFGALGAALKALREGGDEADHAGLESLFGDEATGVSVAASRAAAAGLPVTAAVSALRAEAERAGDPRRAAGQRLLGAAFALSTGSSVEGSGDDARSASEALPGDLAAAELAALFALRGELAPEVGADALDAAAAAGDGIAHRMAEVRAALRRAAVDADMAADAVWRAWNRSPGDASLGALVLRSPHPQTDRAVAVLRSLADAAHAGGGGAAARASVPVGLELAAELEQAGRFADAAQAVARARTADLRDGTLAAQEERLWLRAGMFAEVAERVFDQLKSAEQDEARAVAYESLAELDRVHRGDPATAVASYLALLELVPGHMPTLRALERHFLEQGRFGELAAVYERLVQYAGDGDDALAWAHQGARVAEAEAEDDPGAAVGFYQIAIERNLADRRSLLAIDDDLRRAGDVGRWGETQARIAGLSAGGLERATHLCRAAEARESLGDLEGALAHFEAALRAEALHPTALAGAAELRLAQGDHAGAAAALETLGREARVIETSVGWLHQSAVLWRDKAGDAGRALAVAREALLRDPRHAPCFDLAIELLRAADDVAGELEVLERRAEAEAEGGDLEQRVGWHQRAAELAGRLGEQVRARAQWRAVVRLQPERLEALRALVRLSREAEDWAGAADAMIRLAKVTGDTAERVEMLYGLGEVFDDHMPDARRAEAAYRRALQFDAGDARCLRRLADLYQRGNDAPKEAEVLTSLAGRTPAGLERVAVLLRLAGVLERGTGDTARAEQALELARRDAPTDLGVLRAMAAFYESRGNTAALDAALDRAAGEVRRALDRDPQQLDPLERLAEILTLRKNTDGAQVVAAVGSALGLRSEALEVYSAGPRVAGVGGGGLRDAAVDLLAPRAVSTPLRRVLGQLGAAVDSLVPLDLSLWKAERLGARPFPLRAEVERVSASLGLGPCEIYIASQVSARALPLTRSPAAVLLALDLADDVAGRAAVNRALSLMAASLSLPLRLPPKDFALVLSAMFRQFEPMYRGPGVDPAALDDLARKITRVVPRDRVAEVTPAAFEALGQGPLDADAIHEAVLEFGDRVGVLVSGDFEGAFGLRVPPGVPLSQAVAEVPALGRLVRVTLSDRFVEARRAATAPEEPAEEG